MKRLILLLCVALGFMQTQAQQTNLSVAEDFTKALSTGKYDIAASLFDPSITALNAGVLSSGWQQITAMFGTYKSYYLPKNVSENGTPIIVGIRFEKETKGFACNFNEKHQLVGFLLAPPPEDGSAVLIPSRFKEEAVALKVNGGTLKGSLMLPDNKTQFTPVALIIAGSGPTDRNGNNAMLTTNDYKLLAEALAAQGIASLRYDKRTVGESNDFAVKESDLKFENYIQDAKSLVTFLYDAKSFQNVFIIGHSEGSLIGMVAAQNAHVAGYISLAGAGTNIADIFEVQLGNDATASTIIEQLRKGKQVKEVPEMFNALLRPSVQPFLISWMKYEPAKEIQKIKAPVLILQGTTDIQVAVSNAEKLKQAAPTATLDIIKGMNHILKDAPEDKSANMATYSQPDLPLNAELVAQIVRFMSAK
jgi:pimeloyl-ACP methyl ester carboxylesterase